MERIPPHNEDAEKSVLGAAMLDKDALYDVMEEVRSQDFYNQNHREIFEAITELSRRNSPVDVLTVAEELKKRKSLEMAGGRGYIATLSAGVPLCRMRLTAGVPAICKNWCISHPTLKHQFNDLL